MLSINVAQQLKEPIGANRSYKISDVVAISGDDLRIQGEVGLMRTDRSILVKGPLHGEIELTCGRCLSRFGCRLTLDIEEEYFPTNDIVTGTSLTLPDEPGSFTIDQHNILDLTEAIRQYALMAIPIKPLCRADCAGLCPTCGSNLNQAPCQCPPKSADPRWSELSQRVLATKQKGRN